ncbi:MAG: pyrroloquinoline quinone biosynthesis peptide chaperone PqqD [Pseudomonadota bacterium]|nr:pyrroloquinoline quinone biosynthesis peptide chaperone PqqD [Pseudomonadota bacterium]
MLPIEAIPRLGVGVKFRFDQVRNAWALLAPERLFQPDEVAVEILKLVDGQRSVAMIVEVLVAQFDAPHAVVLADVSALLQDLLDKRVLRV